jgi:hypothetical protein
MICKYVKVLIQYFLGETDSNLSLPEHEAEVPATVQIPYLVEFKIY